jgi:hypothetical protein
MIESSTCRMLLTQYSRAWCGKVNGLPALHYLATGEDIDL